MLQQDNPEAPVQAVAERARYAFVDPDATDEIDRPVSALVDDETRDDADDEC